MFHLPLLARRSLRLGLLVLLAASPASCRQQPATAPERAAPLAKQEPASLPGKPNGRVEPPPSAATPITPAYTIAAPINPAPGWSKLELHDSVPLCVFSDYKERDKALFIAQVTKQTLRANATLTFGVFPQGCLNNACDDKTMLQCWIERDGDTLIAHSRFASFHKDGSTCTKDCLEVDAACETPALAPGEYTLRYGAKRFKLQIPSVVRSPCFSLK
jgi:hypothetical protein